MEKFRSLRDSWKAARRSARIDDLIEGEAKELEKTHNVLLLGLSGSGKSTILKQIRIAYQGGFSHDARMTYREAIYSNLLESAQAAAAALHRFGVAPADPSNVQTLELLLEHDLDAGLLSPTCPFLFTFPSQLMEAIHRLRQDQAVSEFARTHWSQFHVIDNAAYLLTEAQRIASANYVPTETDILWCKQQSTGIVETTFSAPPRTIHVTELGCQRGERRKWIHCFERIAVIVFCSPLSDYDQTLAEDINQNRMAESLVLFEGIVNSRWFLRTSVVLFLNKIDIFQRKLRNVPLEQHFQDYTGGPDPAKAAKYVLSRFMQANRANVSMYPHLTQVTDTSNIRFMISAVFDTICRRELQDSGLL